MNAQEQQTVDHFGCTDVHISQIRSGDTIIHNGELTTVCRNNIKKGGFMGTSLFGDSYRSGSILIKKVNL